MRVYPVWKILHDDDYDSLVDALLKGRDLRREDLEVGPEALHPPELMADLERGVARMEQAVRRGEKIVVYGDYDADGITSTALLLDFLERTGADCDYLLPDRHVDGYGLRPEGVEKALEKGAGLIVTVDNGISSFEAVERASERNVDVVIVDHHRQLDERIPGALAVIDPNRIDCPYPFKNLAGVGVAFKVVQALSQAFMKGEERRRYLNGLLDLVALGTVADVMPVLGENRLFIQRGLRLIDQSGRLGIRRLKETAGYSERPVTTTAIGYHLAPRINVAGRLESADLALRLLRAEREEEAERLARELDRLNGRRQEMQRKALDEADALIDSEDLENDRILVLLGDSWHLGIVGLLAGRLADRYQRPAVVCSGYARDGTYTGSARSIPAYDISAGIRACSRYLTSYGGHPGAAGFSMQEEAFEPFRASLIEHANTHISREDLQPRLEVDLMLRPGDISSQTLDLLDQLEPFGEGNPVPVFGARGCRLISARAIGRSGSHLKLEFEVGRGRHGAVWWNQGRLVEELREGTRLVTAFTLQRDAYAGADAVQMVLKDMAPQEEWETLRRRREE